MGVGAKRLTEPWSWTDTLRLKSVPWLGNKCVKGISCAQPPLYTDVHLVRGQALSSKDIVECPLGEL